MSESNAGREPKVANHLEYFPEEDTRMLSVGMGFIVLPAILAYIAVQLVTDSVGLGVLAGIAVVVWPTMRRKLVKKRPRATLRIVDRSLHLSGPAFAVPGVVSLDDLLDVYLDTKTIQRLREAPSPIPATRFLNQTVGGEQDVARIALELRDETFFLTAERVSHLDANEWFSKIRRFLRQHGWVPEDERE